MQAASSTTVDQVLNKPWCEASRKKAHWDFVLEEMAWMANDFVQESLWKKAAAGQIFEVLLIKQKVGISNLVKTQTQASNSSSKDFDGAVPMDVDFPGMEIADIGSDKVNKQKSKAIIQQYAMPFLKSSGFELMVQAEAPATPKQHSESISTILEPFWEDQFPEEPLFYVVSNGSMEVYRASVESDCTMLEAKHVLELASEHDAEVQAVPGVAEDAAVCSDFGTDGYGNDGSSQDDDLQSHFMLSSLGSGGGLPGIVKKKRKKIAKVNTAGPKLEVGASLPGFVYWPSMSGGDLGSPSLAITGKRSLSGYSDSTNIPGIIPTK
ncbi:unnamed protein product [Sphagnum jensenii]|uniref:HSA domain-containing protein n=1 Tax=Sphagnum jensenii TaxID=128206 RepID=A0ABP1AEC6_9BRYO